MKILQIFIEITAVDLSKMEKRWRKHGGMEETLRKHGGKNGGKHGGNMEETWRRHGGHM